MSEVSAILSAEVPQGAPSWETKSQIGWLDAERILHARAKPGTDIDLVEAREVIRHIGSLCPGEPRPILVDITGHRNVSREARNYFGGTDAAAVESAAALLVNSPLARSIGNFALGMSKNLFPIRLFTSREEAMAWLRGQLP